MGERKSQLEKWETRHGKVKKDEDVIREAEAKKAVENATLEKQGEKIAKQHGMSTEDIFMIIARDSVGTFMKMWNNSMKTAVRETIRTEVRSMLQEELAAAARGFMKGLSMIEPTEFELEPFMANESISNEIEFVKEESIAIEPVEKSWEPVESVQHNYVADERTRIAVIEYYESGNDPTFAKGFKKVTPQHNTIYQHFAKKNPGRGLWKKYVESVIYEHDNAEFAVKNDENSES